MRNGEQILRIILSAVFFAGVLFLPKISWAGPIDTMQLGQWYEVPNSKIRDVLPSPIPSGNGPESIIKAWNSGAYDTTKNRYIVTGGGHNDYGGNEIYTFDINTLRWSRAWGPSPNIPPTQGSCNETYSDGNPVSRHTYDGLEYLPNTDRFWLHSGSLYCGAGDSGNDTWNFDFNAFRWEKKAYAPDSQRLEMVSAYDSSSGKVFVAGPASWLVLREYNPLTNQWAIRGDGNATVSSGQNAAIDPKRKKMVVIGRGLGYVFNLTTSGTISRQSLNSSGATNILNAEAPGLDYDPISDKMIAWSGGANVYSLNLDTNVWTLITPAATNTVMPTAAAPSGTFGRFRYSPSKNAFIVVNSIDENVYVYKLSSGGVPGDTTPPTASITAPASGATVSGSSVAVSANASDNVGVAGVQFKLDGASLGAEDTTSPYLITWNTVQTTNGSHSLTATARDVANNQTTSSGITVTVSNISDTQAPSTPTNLSANVVSSSQINLTWTASSDNVGVTGYRVERCQGAGCTNFSQILTPTATSYSDTSLSANTTYRYQVRAVDAAGNLSGYSSIASATTQALPSGQINLTPGIFYALELPDIGKGIGRPGTKHVTWDYNPLNGRLYSMGGDFETGDGSPASYHQDMYSLSLLERWNNITDRNAGWRQEYPYCGPDGGIQPKSPDFVGWTWDSKRNIFWMVPGTMVQPVRQVCPDETVSENDDPKYKFRHIMTFNPAETELTKRWKDISSNPGPYADVELWQSVYDSVTDSIIRVSYNGGIGDIVSHYNITTGTWTSYTFSSDYYLHRGMIAADIPSRYIYAIGGSTGRLYRYNIDSHTYTDLGAIPGGPISFGSDASNNTYIVWDNINKALLFFRVDTRTIHIYKPSAGTWESPSAPLNTTYAPGFPANLKPWVRHAMVFDPGQNVLALIGNTEIDDVAGGNSYMYLYRYGGTAPDTTPPAAPSGVIIN